MVEFGAFIGGLWLDEGTWTNVEDPQDGEIVGRVRTVGEKRVQGAMEKSVEAFHTLKDMPVFKRADILERAAGILEQRKEEVAQIIRGEAGKPVTLARGEVSRAVSTLKITAGIVRESFGTFRQMDGYEQGKGLAAITRRFPVGPVAAISPFNFPLNLVVHKVAPALAAGCSVVHKPARKTPLSACYLAQILEEAGLLAGAYQVLNCAPEFAGQLVGDPRMALLTFTGSAQVGWELKRQCGHMKSVLELGGNAAAIVEPDADLQLAARQLAVGAFAYSGQVCISVQRIFVAKQVAEEFERLLVAAVNEHVRVGDTKDSSVLLGPMISTAEADRVQSWVEEAVEGGAESLLGEFKRERNVIHPVLLQKVPRGAKVSCEEVFGPVAVIERYEDFGEAIEKVNSSRFGLQAGLFTKDMVRALKAFEELHVGGVVLNDAPTRRVDHMPYGGVKDSGEGREGPQSALEHMTEERLLLIRR